MSERYIRVFSLPKLLYAEGAPIIIMAGAILKDTKIGGVLAQLKFQSIADKTIKAVSVRLSTFDTVNVPLGEDINFQYLDLAIKRNQKFGEQTPIPLPLVETRAFSVVVTKIIFSDNTIWNNEGKPWEELPTTIPLEASLKSHELVKQFQMTYGGSCLYQEEKDLWRCVCGCWNHKGDETCYDCQRNATALSAFDLDKLEVAAEKRINEEEAAKQRAMEAAREARLAKEEQARKETEARKQKAAERKAAIEIFLKKAKKPAITLVIMAVVGVLIFIPIRKNIAYNNALAMIEEKTYRSAISAFEALGDYKDCQEQLKNAKYCYAIKCSENGNYAEAVAIFEELEDYKDVSEQITKTKYRRAINRMEESLLDAYTLFKELPVDYEDVQELKSICEPFLTYSGNVRLVNSKSSQDSHTLSFTSKFYQKNNTIYWAQKGLDYRVYSSNSLTGVIENEYYFFNEPTPVDTDQMCVSDSYNNAMHAKASFQDGMITFEYGYYEKGAFSTSPSGEYITATAVYR